MNKEEILSQLTEISKRLGSEVDSFDIDARVDRIQQLDAQSEVMNARIKYLSEQLANDNNYIDNTPIQYYNMQLAQANEVLRNAQAAVTGNKAEIDREQTIIERTTATIEAGRTETKTLRDKNTELTLAIRRARNNNRNADIATFEAAIAVNNDRISKLAAEAETFEAEIEKHREKITSLSGLTEGLEEEVRQAEAKVDAVKTIREASKTGRIDIAKKEADQALLATLNSTNAALEKQSIDLGYDFARELNTIIADYQSSAITDDELRAKLTDLKGRLPEDFLVSDKEVRDKELVGNRAAQQELELQVDTLERRLSNDDNYRLSPVFFAQTRARIASLNSKISEYDAQIAMVDRQNASALLEIEEYKGLLKLYEDELDEIGIQLAENNGKDAELEKELRAKQTIAHTGIREAKAELERLNVLGLENEEVRKQLEERKARTNELIESNRSKIADPNAIDRSKKRLDQIELQKATAALTALKNREAFLENSIVVALNNIIASKTVKPGVTAGVSEENTNDTVLPFPVSGEVDVDALNKLNGEEEVKEEEVTPAGVTGETSDVELTDEEKALLAGLGAAGLGAAAGTTSVPEVEEIDELAEEHDGFVAVSDTSEVREDLKEKAAKPTFIEKMKKVGKHWKKVVLALVLAGVMMCGLHSCQNQMTNNGPATDTPTSTEQTDDAYDESEDTLEDMGFTIGEGEETGLDSDPELDLDDLTNDTENPENTQGQPNGENVGPGAQENTDPYTETIPGSTEQAADPVDPSTIEDPNANIENTNNGESVDPSTIVDEHPDTGNNEMPEASEDLGEQVEEVVNPGDPTGDDLTDDAWENEEPVFEDENTGNGGDTEDNNTDQNENENENENENTAGGVTGNEEVPEDAWENEEPVIEGENQGSGEGSGETDTDPIENENENENTTGGTTETGESQVEDEKTTEETTPGTGSQEGETQNPETAPEQAEADVVLNEGETFVNDDYAVTNEGGIATTPEGSEDIILSDAVQGVGENPENTDQVVVDLNEGGEREAELTPEQIAEIEAQAFAEAGLSAEEVAELERIAQEKQALENLKGELTGETETLTQDGPVK